ncbi:MAG: hypothetical protein ACYDDI_11335 [Candidatus Acidiferrales bacterium]
MGRTIPTFVQLVEQTTQRWAKFRRALRREDQAHFDRLFQRVRFYTQAATYQCSDNPMEAIFLSVALDQEKRIAALEKLVKGSEKNHATERLDSRPLPLPTGNDAMADRPNPEALPTD